MATNFYFRNFDSNAEQLLIEDLITEVIKIYGYDLFYIPRVLTNLDKIYGEDALSEYNNAYPIEMYVKSVDGYGGEGDFYSKFNIQVRDTVTFTVSRRTFGEEVASQTELVRPREGDLIYFALSNDLFKITFVEHEAVFHALGSLNTWDITCELFEYSSERFNTGIPAIDIIERDNAVSMTGFSILTEDGYILVDEDGFPIIQEQYDFTHQNLDGALEDNDDIQLESDDILDFSDRNPFSESW